MKKYKNNVKHFSDVEKKPNLKIWTIKTHEETALMRSFFVVNKERRLRQSSMSRIKFRSISA